jgi:hypothetical protein
MALHSLRAGLPQDERPARPQLYADLATEILGTACSMAAIFIWLHPLPYLECLYQSDL